MLFPIKIVFSDFAECILSDVVFDGSLHIGLRTYPSLPESSSENSRHEPLNAPPFSSLMSLNDGTLTTMNEDSLRYHSRHSLSYVLFVDTIPLSYAFALWHCVDMRLGFPDIVSSDIAYCKRLFLMGLCKE